MSIVDTTEDATINMMQLKYVPGEKGTVGCKLFQLNEEKKSLLHSPKSGTASDVAGIVSATMFRNTVNDKRIVTPARETDLN